MNTITTNLALTLTLTINSTTGEDTPLFKTIPVGVEEEHGWSTVKFCRFDYKLDDSVLEIQLRNPHKALDAALELFIHPTDLQLREIEKAGTLQDASLAATVHLGGDFSVWGGLQKNSAFTRSLSVFREVESFQPREGMSIVVLDLKDDETLRHMAEWIKDPSGSRGVLGDQIFRVHCEPVYRAALFLSDSIRALSVKRV